MMSVSSKNPSDVELSRRAHVWLLPAFITWFLVALWAAANHLIGRGELPLTLTGFVILPTVAIALVTWLEPDSRRAVDAIPVEWLVAPHLTRLVGVLFLLDAARGTLPWGFALPAGIGDIVTALAALPVLRRWKTHRDARALIAFSLFGILDGVVAVTMGVLHSASPIGVLAGSGPTTQVMGEFPRALIPAFFLPALVLTQLWTLRRARSLTTSPAPSAALPV